MPVAKTYAKMEIAGEPFEESGRMYVNVQAPKGLKKVRWYSDTEYKRMYPDAVLETSDPMMTFNARHTFGFDEVGYITLYKGEHDIIENWAREVWPPRAWYNLTFGFYTPSKINIETLPNNIIPVKLTWDEVKQDDIHMKSHEEVKRYVDVLIGPSTFETNEWELNSWIEKEVKIRTKTTNENYFGTKHKYDMVDIEGNHFIWETGARDYQVNMAVKLKMKVKEIKDNAVVVWYCKEI